MTSSGARKRPFRGHTTPPSSSKLFSAYLLLFCLILSPSAAAQLNDGTIGRELAVTVNDSLTQYIDVHNYLFKITPGRLIPIPGIFEAIDFKVHSKKLDDINADLLKVKTHITSFQKAGGSIPEAREFVRVLDEYVDALVDTVFKLRQVSFQLYKKSHDTVSYSWDTYQEDMRAYEASIDKYMSIAQRLNPLFRNLDDALHRTR